jgi:hypothetical protein
VTGASVAQTPSYAGTLPAATVKQTGMVKPNAAPLPLRKGLTPPPPRLGALGDQGVDNLAGVHLRDAYTHWGRAPKACPGASMGLCLAARSHARS